MTPYAEQLKTLEANRSGKFARMQEIMKAAHDKGLTADDNEGQGEEYDNLAAECQKIDKDLSRLAQLETMAKAAAIPVNGSDGTQASISRDPNSSRIVVLKRELEKGTLFTRYAMAVAAGRGSFSDTIAYARRWDSQTPEVSAYIRMKADPGTANGGSPSWGSELVVEQNLPGEFVELLRPATLLGRIAGIRNVPFNVRIPVQTGGSTVNWVGESAPKPVTQLSFTTLSLGHNKVAGIVVLTEELVRLSTPSAEATVRRDLVEQIARFIDQQFIDPAVGVTANNPASITNGVVAITATGTDAEALYADLNSALATFDATDMGTGSVHILMPPALARGISSLRNALGQFEFTGVTLAGGTLLGFPVLVSNTVPAGTIVVVKADEILMADDGQVTLDASNQATLDMNGGTSPDFNLWQRNCIGIRAERWLTWAKRRVDAVAVIDTAAYGPVAGSPA